MRSVRRGISQPIPTGKLPPTIKTAQVVAKYQNTEHPCSLCDKLGAVV